MSTGSSENTIWPLPKFYFAVTGMPGSPIFSEVSGLEREVQVIEYRAGNSQIFAPIKMPGLQKYGNVTLKKGIFVTDLNLWNYINQIALNTIARQTIVITLNDQGGKPQMKWTLNNAWPTKYTGADLKADANEVAMESMELAYETLAVALS